VKGETGLRGVSPLLEEQPRYGVEDFYELGLLNAAGKPRLKPARGVLLHEREGWGVGDLQDNLRLLQDLYSYWRDEAEFIVLKKEYLLIEKEAEFVAVKCSKRGNDVHERRIRDRLGWLEREISDLKFFKLEDFKADKAPPRSKLLWVTLTYDVKRGDLPYAWENIGEDFNRFMAAVRSRWGEVSCLRTWESFENGYPHIHAILVFKEVEFTVFPFFSEKEGRILFRIKEKAEFEAYWHSWLDIQAISSTSALFNYIRKHQKKILLGLSGEVNEGEAGFSRKVKGLVTMALCWIFRKRSFSVSGDFRAALSDLISHLRNSNMVGQLDLLGNEVQECRWTFLGVFSAAELGIPAYIWAKNLMREEVDRLLRGRLGGFPRSADFD